MGFDGLYMRRVIEEIEKNVKGNLRNIYQYTKVDYFLIFTEGSVRVSLNPNFSFIALMEKYDIPAKMPSSFTMLLRKHIKNSRFLGIEQEGFSRIAKFKFEKRNEFGDLVLYTLYVETMGKFSNMILVDHNEKIIDAHRRIVTTHRELLPRKKFVPYRSYKKDPLEVDITKLDFSSRLKMNLVKNIEGISPLIENEIYHRAHVNEENFDIQSLERAWKEFINEYKKGFTYLLKADGKPQDVSSIRITHLNYSHVKLSPSEALKTLVLFKENFEKIQAKKLYLEKIIKKEMEKLEDILSKLFIELKETEKLENYKKYGELLKTYFYQIPNDVAKISLYDWQENRMISVPLDKKYTPLELSQIYFERYKKLKRKRDRVKERIKEIENEIAYLESALQFLQDSKTAKDILEIEDELCDMGIIKRSKKNKKLTEVSKPRQVRYKNALILIGKNNRQNDKLVREASPNDLWFHAHEIPGAHVILKTDSEKIDDEIIKYAASLAAGYSKAKNSGKVPVDFTKIKYVKKPKGAKPGFVIYKNYKTISVTPQRLED